MGIAIITLVYFRDAALYAGLLVSIRLGGGGNCGILEAVGFGLACVALGAGGFGAGCAALDSLVAAIERPGWLCAGESGRTGQARTQVAGLSCMERRIKGANTTYAIRLLEDVGISTLNFPHSLFFFGRVWG